MRWGCEIDDGMISNEVLPVHQESLIFYSEVRYC